jgi:hypothetical protein
MVPIDRGTSSEPEVAIVPDERPSVRNEKRYEALTREGMSKERGEDRQLARRLRTGRQAIRLR